MLRRLLKDNHGRIYIYLATDAIAQQFLQDAEQEGFTFADGAKPTQRHASTIMAINRDMTINYVGAVGHIAFRVANTIGGQCLIKIDYRTLKY